jgi:hypothetical protein
VSGSFSVAGSTSYSFGSSVTGIKVSLRGSGTITLSSNGSLLKVNFDQTLILRDIALVGKTANNAALVFSYGALSMRSGTIRDNFGGDAGGVWVYSGTFAMSGGTISGNSGYSGGVVVEYGTFTMSGGIISGNIALYGGGVYVNGTGEYPGAFTKTGGIIYGNNAGDNSNTCPAFEKGHAVYYSCGTSSESDDYYRNTTLGEGDNLTTTNTSSGWEQ